MKHWPNLSESSLASARRDIERVVRAVLGGESRVELDASVEDAYAIGIGAYTSGTGALLARWIENGTLTTNPSVRETLSTHLAHGRKRVARIQHELLPAIDALLGVGIVPVVIKGLHIALAYCEEPGVRPMADVDVVVPPEKVTAAESALARAGFELLTRTRHAPKSDWIAYSTDRGIYSNERPDVRSRWTLELHQSFDRDFKGVFVAHLDSERHSVRPFEISARSVLAPAQPLLLLTLACQLSSELDAMRLRRLIDLVLVIRTDRENRALDWDVLLATLKRTDTARFTYPAFALVEHLAPGTVDPRVLQAGRTDASWALRNVVDALSPAGEVLPKRSVVRTLMWAQSPAQVVSGAVGVVARKMGL